MASFHICKACRSAYKVFFDGARDAHVDPQEWVFVRALEGRRAEIRNVRREKMQITETQIAGSRIKMRLAEITPDTQKEVAALELSVELSKLPIPDGAMVVPNPQGSLLGELQVRALRYVFEGLCQ